MSAPEPVARSATGRPLAVEAVGVRRAFVTPAGTRHVLDGVDVSVDPGEVVALAGRSGSGKTTLLAILAGWERADDGTIAVAGRCPPAADVSWVDIAVLPQTLGLLEELTIRENVALPLRLCGGPNRERDDPDRLMARLGLDRLGDRFPSEVSLGEQQRTALARAAVVRPSVLLADEPVAHQNVAWAEVMMASVRELAESGTACLVAAHDEVVLHAADRVVELHEGVLRARPGGRRTA